MEDSLGSHLTTLLRTNMDPCSFSILEPKTELSKGGFHTFLLIHCVFKWISHDFQRYFSLLCSAPSPGWPPSLSRVLPSGRDSARPPNKVPITRPRPVLIEEPSRSEKMKLAAWAGRSRRREGGGCLAEAGDVCVCVFF